MDAEKQLQQFQPCIDSFRMANTDDGSKIIDLLKRSMELNRKIPIPSMDATTPPKMASIMHCLNIFQSISDDIVCETIIETLQQLNASKFPIYKKLIAHFSPAKFKFEITQPRPNFFYVSISSLSGGSQCLKLSFPNPTSLQIDALDKCAADKGPELLQAVHSFARTIPTITHIKLTDVSSVDVCGVSIPLAALKIVTTGQSWYNRYHYYSENFLVETQHNQGVINRLFKDIISERPDIFSPDTIEEMNELHPISPDVTFKDYMLAFEQSIGRDKNCDKRKATSLLSIMSKVDDNMWKSNFGSHMDKKNRPFLIYCPELQLDLSKHGGKRRRLQTMRNYKKGAKNSKRNINKSKRNINKRKRNINKSKRNINKIK
jgi:hypothetical protein